MTCIIVTVADATGQIHGSVYCRASRPLVPTTGTPAWSNIPVLLAALTPSDDGDTARAKTCSSLMRLFRSLRPVFGSHPSSTYFTDSLRPQMPPAELTRFLTPSMP